MTTNTDNEYKGSFFQNIFAVLKKRLLIIISIVIAVTLIGAVVAYNKKPTYTAKENLNYMARAVNSTDNTKININAMRDYIDTVVDFCDEDIVLLRADGLYIAYKESGKLVDEFIDTYLNYFDSTQFYMAVIAGNSSMKEAVADFESASGYRNTGEVQQGQQTYFNSGSVGASTLNNSYDDTSSFVFKLSVQDGNAAVAKTKLRILALAVKIEIYDTFGGVTTTIEEMVNKVDEIGVSTNLSKKKIVLVSFLLGIIAALVVVYLIEVFDKTVKDKEVLEKLTGANVIAYINDEGEQENG